MSSPWCYFASDESDDYEYDEYDDEDFNLHRILQVELGVTLQSRSEFDEIDEMINMMFT
jgi:hypothetical protein